MILVIVGMHPTKPFDRLVIEMERIAGLPQFKNRVMIQKGCSKHAIVNSTSCDFLDIEELEATVKSSEIIVAHAGIGTIIDSQRFRKVIVIMPRRCEFGEAVNGHQVKTAQMFANDRNILVANQESELLSLIERAIGMRYDGSHSDAPREQLISHVRSLIEDAESDREYVDDKLGGNSSNSMNHKLGLQSRGRNNE